jgi:hypothetical protein
MLYSIYDLKRNEIKTTYNGIIMKSEADPPTPRVIDFPNVPRDTWTKVTLVARPLLTPVEQKLRMCGHTVFATQRVFVLEHYFVSKWLTAVCEIFNDAHPLQKTFGDSLHLTHFRGQKRWSRQYQIRQKYQTGNKISGLTKWLSLISAHRQANQNTSLFCCNSASFAYFRSVRWKRTEYLSCARVYVSRWNLLKWVLI